MGMRVDQEFMDEYVIKPMAKRIADLEKKIDLAVSNSAHLVQQFNKVIKNMKKK